METGLRSQSTFVYNVDREDPISINLDGGPRVYFPGDRITGKVRLGLQNSTPGQLVVFLTCKARLQSGKQRPLFKVSLDPYIVTGATTVNFSILIPSDIPSSIHHERISGSINYNVKAVHKQPDLPCCVWPKASAAVEILDRISVLDDCYTKELTSEGQLSFNIPHDIIMKQCVLKKGTIETASAWVHVPRSCYLPDQVIPVTLQIRHFAPIRLVDGVTLHLDRITQTMAANDQVSYDTMSIAHVALPLSCDDHTFQTKFTTNALKIPADTPPTLDSHRYPLRITYRLRAIINLDMEGLPLRKRDRVASYVGKVMRFTEEMNANGSTIVLDVPLVVGTTEEPPNSSVKSLFDGGYGLFKEENKLITCLPETVPSMLLSPPPEYTTSPSVLVRRLSIAKADDYFDQAPPYSVAKHPSAPNLQDFPPFHFDSIPRQPSAPSLQELSDPPNEKAQCRTWSHPLQHRRTSSTTSLHNLPPPPPPHHVHEYSRESL